MNECEVPVGSDERRNMPKSNLITRDLTADLIKGRSYYMGYGMADLYKKADLKEGTMRDHLRDPGKLRLSEIRAMDRVLHFTDTDLIELVRGRGK